MLSINCSMYRNIMVAMYQQSLPLIYIVLLNNQTYNKKKCLMKQK